MPRRMPLPVVKQRRTECRSGAGREQEGACASAPRLQTCHFPLLGTQRQGRCREDTDGLEHRAEERVLLGEGNGVDGRRA